MCCLYKHFKTQSSTTNSYILIAKHIVHGFNLSMFSYKYIHIIFQYELSSHCLNTHFSSQSGLQLCQQGTREQFNIRLNILPNSQSRQTAKTTYKENNAEEKN
jgi:hypothetical protein